MNKKPTKKKKISFALPEREGEMLARYAKEKGISRPAAVRRMVRTALQQYSSTIQHSEPQNQLGLFDVVQIDIFNSTSKVNNDD